MRYGFEDIVGWYELSFWELMERVREVHQPGRVKWLTALSIKTGACSGDCGFCPQSVHANTGVIPTGVVNLEEALAYAEGARRLGIEQICLGCAWKGIPDDGRFEKVLEIVKGVSDVGLKVCASMGLARVDQLERLKAAGCWEYNHNLDSSRRYYKEVITTHTYDERLATIAAIREVGLRLSCGGIIGMGETVMDRLELLYSIYSLEEEPKCIPLNVLNPVKGTKLGDMPAMDRFEYLRVVAIARLLMPEATVALAAGRDAMSMEMQALCFMAGANGIYVGEKILTTPTPELAVDYAMFEKFSNQRVSERVLV